MGWYFFRCLDVFFKQGVFSRITSTWIHCWGRFSDETLQGTIHISHQTGTPEPNWWTTLLMILFPGTTLNEIYRDQKSQENWWTSELVVWWRSLTSTGWYFPRWHRCHETVTRKGFLVGSPQIQPSGWWSHTQTIQGTGIFTYIYHKQCKNKPFMWVNIPYMDDMG